jgi:hypothetical protein
MRYDLEDGLSVRVGIAKISDEEILKINEELVVQWLVQPELYSNLLDFLRCGEFTGQKQRWISRGQVDQKKIDYDDHKENWNYL